MFQRINLDSMAKTPARIRARILAGVCILMKNIASILASVIMAGKFKKMDNYVIM